MPEDLAKKSEALMEGLVKDVREKLPILKKLRAMSKLAKDIGDDVPEMDRVLGAAEDFADMVIKRFEKSKPKE